MTARLAALDPALRASDSERIRQRLLDQPELADAASLVCCLSFGPEPDTWPLLEQLVASGRTIFVPATVRADRSLTLHRWPCPLVTRSFGLCEPAPGTPALPVERVDDQIDAVLVLGLAFDRAGFRLGHGAGYFDRFLAARPFPAIALAHSVQLLDTLPSESHDVPMSVIVTPNQALRPPSPT